MTRSWLLSRVNTSRRPRRSTPLIFVPSSCAWNALRDPLRCTAFATGTSTDLTRRPTVSRSRPRRMVSISGSSGIAVLVVVLLRLQLGHQGGVGVTGGDLLGLLLGPAVPRPPGDAADLDRDAEPAGVVGPLRDRLVARGLVEVPGRQLLQPALEVLAARPAGVGLGDPAAEQPHDEGVGLLHPGGHVDGAEHRLEGVGEDRGLLPTARLLLPLAEQQVLAEAELVGHLGERHRVDDRLADVGELALAEVGVGVEGVVGDDQPEDGVAEELEALVRLVAGVLGAPRAV